MSETPHLSDEEIKENLAAIRARIAFNLADDPEALRVLDSVFPADWADVPEAVVWLLGNAARFADPDTNSIGTPALAQGWLDRLVDPDGNPIEDPAASDVHHVRIYIDAGGEYRWSAIAANGEPVAQGESHRDSHDAKRAARGVLGVGVEIRDETEAVQS